MDRPTQRQDGLSSSDQLTIRYEGMCQPDWRTKGHLVTCRVKQTIELNYVPCSRRFVSETGRVKDARR